MHVVRAHVGVLPGDGAKHSHAHADSHKHVGGPDSRGCAGLVRMQTPMDHVPSSFTWWALHPCHCLWVTHHTTPAEIAGGT